MNSNTILPIATILNQNKLMESNFIDWKRTLDIVLIASRCRYVLTIPSLPEPELDAPQFEKDLYTKWTKDNEMARYFIQATMSNILQHQDQSYKSAYDIISNLKEMFADQLDLLGKLL